MKEFQLIRQIQRQTSTAPSGSPSQGVVLGIGDDAALLDMPPGRYLVAATDTLNAGIHFPSDSRPFDIAFKCLAVNLSDLAAMGAVPHWALLSLCLPEASPEWVADFTEGFSALARSHDVALVGGDTSRGPLSVCVTVLGSVAPGEEMTRGGARPGDLLVVSGALGGAARTLDLIKAGSPPSDRRLLDRPEPRVRLGQKLAGLASACIDISDGLLADLGHVLTLSGCGARLELANLPAGDSLAGLGDEQKWHYQLSGGDDYELLFSLPRSAEHLLGDWSRALDLDLSIIGVIEKEPGIRCVRPDGSSYQPRESGYEHFSDK